jgi:hypothetical protein
MAVPRWLTSSISKALPRQMPSEMLSGFESPLDLLVTRNRIYFPDGNYKGVAYRQTALSQAVYTSLRELEADSSKNIA